MNEVKLKQEDIVAGGVCAKQISIPKDTLACKHVHEYDHVSILAQGHVRVCAGKDCVEYKAPSVVVIKAGVEHSILAYEDSVWFCVHSGEHSDEVVGG